MPPSLLLAALTLSIALPGLLAAASEQPYAAHRPVFMLFGDSLTEFGYGYHWKYNTDKKGWVTLLAEAYSRKADIVNRGMSGYNTRWALQVLPQALTDMGCSSSQAQQQQQQQQRLRSRLSGWGAGGQAQGGHCNVALLTIWFGANDNVDPSGADGRLHVPVGQFRSNLVAMVTAARQAGVQQVLLVTPPPVDEAAWAKEHGWETSDRRNARVALYAAAVRAVAKQLQVPLLDIHSKFSQQGANLQVLLNDGVHFSPEGNQLVAKSLRDLLETHADLAGVRAGALPNHYPLFDQIDAANPERTFSELFQRQLVVPGGQKKAGPTQSTLQ